MFIAIRCSRLSTQAWLKVSASRQPVYGGDGSTWQEEHRHARPDMAAEVLQLRLRRNRRRDVATTSA
jgi:hypothetical protein